MPALRPALLVVLTFLVSVLAAPRPARADAAKAADLYKRGMAAYALEDWDGAIAEWEKGFREEPKPEFLYNIAQAHRQAGRHEPALRFYQRYLDLKPEASDRADVERLIRVLRQAISEKQRAIDAPPVDVSGSRAKRETPVEPEPTAAPAPAPASAPAPRGPDYVMIGLLSAGGVAAATGIALAVSGSVTSGKATDTSTTTDLGDRQNLGKSGASQSVAGYCLIGAGAALLVGGVIKAVMKPKGDVAVGVGLARNAAFASVGGSF